ncbi:MAG: hypothetical protein KDC98_19945 [Planctomycetes bacterium]|nr:hypothetical protein [Planctomycetota bacterium]
MRILSSLLTLGILGSSLPAQATCSAGPAPATTLATMNPFAGTSLYGHPGYPTLPGPTFPGFSYLIDIQAKVNVELSRLDIDLYDDGNLVQINTTTTVTSPYQVGATAPVTIYLYPGTTWTGNETNQPAWGVLGSGTLTVSTYHTDSQVIFNPPVLLPAGDWGIAIQVPQTTNGPNPGPLHPMVDPTTTTPGVYVDPAITLLNVMFQRESWTASLTSPAHTQSLEFHFQATSDYANWTSFGTGCGQPTAPALGLGSRPVIGTTIDFDATNIAAAAQFNFWLFGLTPDAAGTNLAPYGLPGCSLHLALTSPITTTVSAVTGGAATSPLPIPNSPTFSGVVFFGQAAPLLGGNPAFQLSNAVCVAIGLY